MNDMAEPQPGYYCSVAFKEWAGVCDALGAGRQSIILRKGGISEEPGPGGFVPDHREFWLYPTFVHQSQQGLRVAVAPMDRGPFDPAVITIGLLGRVELIARVEDESALVDLEPYHVLTPATVRGRFHYRTPGLWVLAVRIWRHEPPYRIAATAEHAGCKTWVTLDEPLATSDLVPTIGESDWAERLEGLRRRFPTRPGAPPGLPRRLEGAMTPNSTWTGPDARGRDPQP
ncbi:MAG: DUF1802 family protein [Isosphaeraceae bacterium]